MLRLRSVSLLGLCLLAPLVACGKDETAPKSGSGPASSQPSKGPGGAGAGYGYATNLGEDLDKKAGDAIAKGKIGESVPAMTRPPPRATLKTVSNIGL